MVKPTTILSVLAFLGLTSALPMAATDLSDDPSTTGDTIIHDVGIINNFDPDGKYTLLPSDDDKLVTKVVAALDCGIQGLDNDECEAVKTYLVRVHKDPVEHMKDWISKVQVQAAPVTSD